MPAPFPAISLREAWAALMTSRLCADPGECEGILYDAIKASRIRSFLEPVGSYSNSQPSTDYSELRLDFENSQCQFTDGFEIFLPNDDGSPESMSVIPPRFNVWIGKVDVDELIASIRKERRGGQGRTPGPWQTHAYRILVHLVASGGVPEAPGLAIKTILTQLAGTGFTPDESTVRKWLACEIEALRRNVRNK